MKKVFILAALLSVMGFNSQSVPLDLIFYKDGAYFTSDLQGGILCVSHASQSQVICVPIENYDKTVRLSKADTL